MRTEEDTSTTASSSVTSRVGYVYALVDPRDNVIRYIGQSVNPKGRAHGHTKDALKTLRGESDRTSRKIQWLMELDGCMPELRILEEHTQGQELDDAEERWIAELRPQLTNVSSGATHWPVREEYTRLCCSVEGCGGPERRIVTTRPFAMCKMHAIRWNAHGSVADRPRSAGTPLEKFKRRVTIVREHWLWDVRTKAGLMLARRRANEFRDVPLVLSTRTVLTASCGEEFCVRPECLTMRPRVFNNGSKPGRPGHGIGVPVPPERRAKIGATLRGRRWSEESIAKRSATVRHRTWVRRTQLAVADWT